MRKRQTSSATKKEELKPWTGGIMVQRIEEEGHVMFEAECPISDCTHKSIVTVHYGEEEGAKKAATGNIAVHLRIEHGYTVD